jgi:cytochrome c oxidase assembly factor 5
MAGNKPSDCLRLPLSEELPIQCQQLKKGYGDCKRGMIDMRKRFRGNKPVGILDSAPGGEQHAQMYGTIGIKKKEPVVEPVEGESER